MTARTTLLTLTATLYAAAGVAPSPALALPTVELRTARSIPNEPKVAARVEVGAFRGQAGVEVRGTASRRFPKRSYSLELRGRRGKDRRAGLLGMPADADWVLYASYNDKSLVRTLVALRAARRLGRWAPRAEPVELRLNGRYEGVYLLMERPELNARRQRAAKDAALVEMTDAARPKDDVLARGPASGRSFVLTDPDRDELPKAAERSAEARLRALDAALGGTGDWRTGLDEDAAVDQVLLQELIKNTDAFKRSTFMVVPPRDPVVLGPPWDFDLSLGNAGFPGVVEPSGWIGLDRPWARRLLRDPGFAAKLHARWRALSSGGLLQRMLADLDADVRTLGAAPQRNFARWPILGRQVWANPVDPATGRPPADYAGEVRYLREWLVQRVGWIDANVGRLGAAAR